jgi:hypothetical protein
MGIAQAAQGNRRRAVSAPYCQAMPHGYDANVPATIMHSVALGGGYGQKRLGTAIYYYCAECHAKDDRHKATDMARVAACVAVKV